MTSPHGIDDERGSEPGGARPADSGLNRRRFFMISSGAAASVLLAACGSNSGLGAGSTAATSGPVGSTSAATTAVASSASSASSAGSAGSAAGATTGPASSAPATSGGVKATLAQWYHQYGEAGTQQAVEGYAKAYPDATVSIQWIPGDYDGKVASSLLTDSGPDVFEAGNGPSIDAIQGGQVLALDGILGEAKDDFTASLIQRMTYDGKLYAVPQVIDMQLMVYRKSMLDKAGVKPPTTFDELIAAAKALTDGTVKGLFVGNDGGVGVLPGPMLWSLGADYLTADNKVGFKDPSVATAFSRLHDLFTSGSLLLGAPTDWSDPSAITQGLCAMQWTGLWTFPVLAKELGDDFGVLPWPKYAAGGPGKAAVPIGAYGSVVSAKSKNPEAAKAFVKWLWVDNTDDQLDFAQSFGFHVPARQSLAGQAEKLKTGPAAEAVKILQDYGHAQTPLLWTPAAGTAMSDALNRIIKDGADPAKEMAAVAAKTESELQRVLK